MKIVSRRAIVIKRHEMRTPDDRSMSLLLLVRRPDHAIVSHLGQKQLDNMVTAACDAFIAMCVTVDEWPAPTSLHFLEDFTKSSDDTFTRATSDLLTSAHVINFEPQLARFTQARSEHFARALWSLERRPRSEKIEWQSDRISRAATIIVTTLIKNAGTSPTLREICEHYYGETPSKRKNGQT